jgi:hypothetical protein
VSVTAICRQSSGLFGYVESAMGLELQCLTFFVKIRNVFVPACAKKRRRNNPPSACKDILKESQRLFGNATA